MSVYNSLQDLLNDATAKGLIKLSIVNLQFGQISIVSPTTSFTVLNSTEWKKFLSHIVENTDHPVEKQQASIFLNLTVQFEQYEDQRLKNSRLSIDDIDIQKLHAELESCKTIEDIELLIDKNLLSKNDQSQQEKTKAINLVKLRWKKSILVDNKIRYYSYDLDWYIEKQFSQGPKNGKKVYYSIFSNENKEIARFDTLKDAKQNLPHLFNLS
jgi:hypothetical protein